MFNSKSRVPAQALLWLIVEARLNSDLRVNEKSPEVRAIIEAHQSCAALEALGEAQAERDGFEQTTQDNADVATDLERQLAEAERKLEAVVELANGLLPGHSVDDHINWHKRLDRILSKEGNDG